MFYKLQKNVAATIKKTFGIADLNLYVRMKKQRIEKLFFHKKYSAKDLVGELVRLGMKPGSVVLVHCAMNNFYNYQGSVDELIDELLQALGPQGTLCMPAYPYDKNNVDKVFDVRNDKTAAGLLAETFRKRKGVKRSMNKLHSVCAYGLRADEIVGEHHLSETCFDEKSPFYKIAQLGGISIALGLPKYYIGTLEHVEESLLRSRLLFFKNKFTTPMTFTYIDNNGSFFHHTMYTKANKPYIRSHTTKLVDKYFDQSKYTRERFSNLWINIFDAKYLVDRLSELALEGKTLYKYPKFYN